MTGPSTPAQDTARIVLPSVSPAAGTRRILLADDEEALARALKRLLVAAGFEVQLATGGAEALDALVGGQFDVIVTDVNMPGATGVDVLRVVRAYDLDVPVVLMTAAPELATAMEAIELGAFKYLVKPIPPDELLKVVERASRLHRMAQAKREALALNSAHAPPAGDRAGLMAGFDHALQTMWLAFQPIVSVPNRRTIAYEALLRTQEPTMGHPEAVVAAAERLDRLPELGRRVRDIAASAFAAAPDDVWLFLNLHTLDLLDPHLASSTAPLSKMAHRVVLEITERRAIDDVADVEQRISILRYMGFRIAIDDLGAGYAGLNSFARLEPDFVKLDISLVHGVHQSSVRQKLVGAMAALSREMGITVIAEGIEVAEERDEIQRLGCELMQGFLFARPQPGFV